MFNLNDLWLGDANSLREAVRLEAQAILASATMKAGMVIEKSADAGEQLPRLYSRHANVGIISVRGPLVNSDSWITEYLGISTYPAIRDALVFAAQDGQVDQILLDIDSPGGTVSGVNDTARLVRTVGTVKPITTYSSDLMASAGYWIGSAAKKIHVGETAIIGSIGVIATLTSVHDALKKEGVDVRVIRAGKNKALGHPAEPISDKAVAQTQDRADTFYGIFKDAVSTYRPKLKADSANVWAEGNEFLGEDAVKAGLADRVSSFDQVVSQLVVDKPNSLHNTSATKIRGNQMPKAILDPKLVALAASGVTLTAEQQAELDAGKAAVAAEAVEAEAKAKLEADAKVKADAEAAAKVEADAKVAADAEAKAKADAAAKGAAGSAELVKYLEGQVEARNKERLAAEAAQKVAEDKIAAMQAPHDALVKIARDSINSMTIGLNGRATDLSALSAIEVVARHAATLADFTKAYPVGGVAATTPEDKPAKKSATVTPLYAAQREMVGLSK